MLTLVQTSNKCQQHSWLIYFNLNLTKSLKYLSLAELPSLLIYSIPPENSWLPFKREGLKKTSKMKEATRYTLLTLLTLSTLLTCWHCWLLTLFILFKPLYTAVHCFNRSMYIHVLLGKVRKLLEWADTLLSKKWGDVLEWVSCYPLDCYDY